jgi:HNH endonuclease
MTALNAEACATERINRPDSWRADFIKRSGFRCHYCNRRGAATLGPDDRPWHVDHMHPVSRGGSDEDDNLVLACKRCNLSKGAQPYGRFSEFARLAFWVPDDWRVSEGDLDSLMDSYAGWGDKQGQDREWKIDASMKAICVFNADQQFTPLLELGEFHRAEYRSYLEVLYLVADMYKALPAMIAEIRMHRAAERGDAA